MIETQEINRLVAAFSALNQSKAADISSLEKEVSSCSEELEQCKKCQEVFRVVSNERRYSLKTKLESLLSYGLSLVFEESLKVKVEYKKWGNSDRAYLYVEDGFVMTELTSFRGGGFREVASFLVRLLILCLYMPHQRKLILGDEIFGAVRGDRQEILSLLIKKLTEKLNIQVLLVENPGPFEHADIVYDMTKEQGKSVLRKKV